MTDKHTDWGRTTDSAMSVGAWHRYTTAGKSVKTVCGMAMSPSAQTGPLPPEASISTVCPFCLQGRSR